MGSKHHPPTTETSFLPGKRYKYELKEQCIHMDGMAIQRVGK